MAVCIVAGLALAWQSRGSRAQAARWQQRLASERREKQALEAQVLLAAAGGRERAAEIEHERQVRRGRLAALARGEAARLADAPIPATRTAACAALAAMAQELRDLANGQGIGVAPGEAFGFAEFAQSGPAADLRAEVHRQSRIVAAAVRLLVAAQPAEIRRVSCGKPPGPDDRATNPEGLAGRTTVRLEFSGHTEVLRKFLNGLAGSELLLRVSSVEVNPARPDTPPAEGSPGELWLSPETLVFAVTLECVHLTPGAIAEIHNQDRAEAPVPGTAIWSQPALALASATHCDLFTAPVVAYDLTSGGFTVQRLGEVPQSPVIATDPAEAVTLVPPKPYRIQLLGHFGDGADLVGTFSDLESGLTFLARAGQTVPKAAIAVRTLQRVRRSLDNTDVENGVHGWVTMAEIEDLLTGSTRTLIDGSREAIEVMP